MVGYESKHNTTDGHSNIGKNTNYALATGLENMAEDMDDVSASGNKCKSLGVGGSTTSGLGDNLTMINALDAALTGYNVNAIVVGGAVSGSSLAVLADKGATGHDVLGIDYLNDIIGARKLMVVVALAGDVIGNMKAIC